MRKFLIITGLMMLVACDPAVYYEKVIQNDSSYDIWLIKSDSTATTEFFRDSVLLFSKDQLVIGLSSDIGGDLNQFESCPLYPFASDTLFTRIDGNDSLRLKVIIDQNADWVFKVIEPGQNGEAECRLILTDNDIE